MPSGLVRIAYKQRLCYHPRLIVQHDERVRLVAPGQLTNRLGALRRRSVAQRHREPLVAQLVEQLQADSKACEHVKSAR